MQKFQAFIKKHSFSICSIIIIFIFITVSFCVYATKSQTDIDETIENTEKVSISNNVLLIRKPYADTYTEDQSSNLQDGYYDLSQTVPENNFIPNSENEDIYSSLNDSDTVATLSIPKLNINYPVLANCSTELLKISLNKFWGCNPNEVGNFCVVGHNYKNGKFFSNLLSIKNGDIIKLTDLYGKTMDYSVYDTFIVDPEDTDCTSQLTDGHTDITLITCYYVNNEVHASKRFIVKARAD